MKIKFETIQMWYGNYIPENLIFYSTWQNFFTYKKHKEDIVLCDPKIWAETIVHVDVRTPIFIAITEIFDELKASIREKIR